MKERKPNFFDEFQGTTVKAISKFLDDGSVVVYKGILEGKSRTFIYLRDCEAVKVKDGKEADKKKFERIALNKSIIAMVDFS